MNTKTTAKKILGEMPLTAELYWYLRQGGNPPRTGYKLDKIQERLPLLVEQAIAARHTNHPGKNVLIFATLHFWIAHGTVLGLALAAQGHNVTLAYLPYSNSNEAINKFDLRRQNIYTEKVLAETKPLMDNISFLERGPGAEDLPGVLHQVIDQVSLRDTQYIMQVEDIPENSPLYMLRQTRNLAAATAAYRYVQFSKPDVVIIPNGSILEFGSVFQVARYLEFPTVTYEFGEQRNRIWIAQDSEVMHQRTDALWQTRQGMEISAAELERVETLYSSRQKASLWGNFSRQWQGVPTIGGDQARRTLGLDERPVILLATNVIGDSLTLGRQVFSDSMTEWLQRTLEYFASHHDAQLVVRIHPGELVTKGPSVGDVVHQTFPKGIPENITLISADAEINTYDLIEIADLGLVYTTTVGMEMAMRGVPVIVIGQTHYREKGFTLDPDSWDAFFELLTNFMVDPEQYRLSKHEIGLAREYAYRFFFEYPQPYPWHLLHLWDDIDEAPIEAVLSDAGMQQYGDTFRYLVGEPIDWSK
ncbi:MAG: hypothetical protein ACK2UM_07950 [Anaerolineales bacterium]